MTRQLPCIFLLQFQGVLLAGIIPLGIAMQQSGTANLVANFILDLTPFASPLVLMIALYFITTILTEFISNNAAAVLLVVVIGWMWEHSV